MRADTCSLTFVKLCKSQSFSFSNMTRMNSNRFPRLSVIMAGILLLATFACDSKKDEPQPDAAASVAGRYNVTFLRLGNTQFTLPQNGTSAIINVTRQTETTVAMTCTVTSPGAPPENIDFGSLTVNRQGDDFNLLESGQQVGTIRGNALNISGTDEDGAVVELRATK